MLIQEIITLAKHSELNSVAVKNDNSAIVAFINLAMTELYKQFNLSVYTLQVTPTHKDYVSELPINFMYAIRCHRIEIKNNKEVEVEIPINETYEEEYISFINFKQVKFSEKLANKKIYITYNVKPLPYTTNDLNKEIDLPDVLIPCLLHYLGYKAHLGVRSDGQSETNAHYMRYINSIKEAKNSGMLPINNSVKTIDRILNRGFV